MCACLCDVDGVVAVAWEQGAKEEGGREGREGAGRRIREGWGRGGREGERRGERANAHSHFACHTSPGLFGDRCLETTVPENGLEINPETLKALNLNPYTS